MALTVTSAKLTGNPTQTSWVQVHDFTPEDDQKLKMRGRLVALFCVESQGQQASGFDAVRFGREILARFHEEYYGELTKPAFAALSQALKVVKEEFSSDETSLEIGAIAFLGSVLYVGTFKTQAYLLRNGNFVKILGVDSGLASASGHPKADDVFLLGSQAFFQILPQGTIKGAFSNKDISEAVQKLTPALHASETLAAKAGAFALAFTGEERVFVTRIKEPLVNPPLEIKKGGQPAFWRLGLANFLGRLANVFPERKIRVREETSDLESDKRKKVAATAGAILVILLVISIGFGVKQKRQRDVKSAYAPRLNEAWHQFEEAKSLAGLNPGRARELVLGAKTTAFSLKEEGVQDGELENLLLEIENNMGSLAGIYEPSFETFDLALISNGFKGDSLSLSGGTMLVLDKAGEKLVSMKIATKKTQIVATGDVIEAPIVPAAYADKNYLLADEGIFELNNGESELVVEKDWGSDSLFYVYAGNLYVLDKNESALWRYSAIDEGFANKQNWFGAGVNPDLSRVVSWSIDGAVWLLSSSGRISKFTLGKSDSFAIDGLNIPLASAVSIYTNEENQYLYLLDAANSRIVVLDKKGGFKAEYVSDKIKEGRDLVASEKEGKIIILTGEKLYFGQMEHL